jgi:hypothetical protein
VSCSLLAALAVAIDAYFSAREGYLSRPPYFDGAGYMFYARQGYQLILGHHLHTAYTQLIHTIAPGWTSLLAFHYLVFGAGPWQAFSVRFWPVALFVLLVYWIVRRRAPRSLAIAATVLTALVPSMSAGVRSSSLEFLTGYTNYLESWYQDDLRPDLLGVVLILWAVAILAEHSKAPTRSSYLVSATFAAAAVLVKSSTTPLLLLIWAETVAIVWFLNRRRTGNFRNAALSVVLLTLLLTPWAFFGGGISNVVGYLYEAAVTYNGIYGTNENVLQRLTYFSDRIPTDLGPIEGWLVIGAAVIVTIALLRRSLGPAELIYGAIIVTMYLIFDLGNTRDAHYAEWTSLALWIYVWAGVARLAARWRWPSPRLEPALLATIGLYTLIVYSLGAFALVHWPANEHSSNAQLFAVTASVADELGRHITSSDCFVSAPGPGWPASIQFVLVDAHGGAPGSVGIDPSLPPDHYVESAKQCAAVLTFREDIAQAAQAFSAVPGYQPYYRAIDEWVRNPASGYTLDRSWSFTDLPPYAPHTLGRYQGASVTVDLFLRNQGQS